MYGINSLVSASPGEISFGSHSLNKLPNFEIAEAIAALKAQPVVPKAAGRGNGRWIDTD
jgi:hypothetical protein